MTRGNPKPAPYKQVKAKRRREETTVKRSVREQCVERDGYCLLQKIGVEGCDGPSEWAHIGEHRRSKTRGMAPERRHTTAGSAMLCRAHHARYDAHEFDINPWSGIGMDGPFTVVA